MAKVEEILAKKHFCESKNLLFILLLFAYFCRYLVTDTSNTVVSVSRKVVDTFSIKSKGIIDNILYSSLH